jgi:hypothetical protein
MISGWIMPVEIPLALTLFVSQAFAAPITIVPGTVNSLRDSRGVNDVGVGSGEINQFGANIIPSLGSTITAAQGGFVDPPRPCGPLTTNPNFCAGSAAFSLNRLGSWTSRSRMGRT